PGRVAAGVLPRGQRPRGRQSRGHRVLRPVLDLGVVVALQERRYSARRAPSRALSAAVRALVRVRDGSSVREGDSSMTESARLWTRSGVTCFYVIVTSRK